MTLSKVRYNDSRKFEQKKKNSRTELTENEQLFIVTVMV